jgi:DNA polymerase I-like protein with 3'-5' exonuclease and polymerase domains
VTRYTQSTRKKPMAERVMSTDATALGTLAAEQPVVKRIVHYKELTTLSTRYLAKYLKEYNFAEDGMAHPSHIQCAVISGRFAVTDPAYNQTPGLYHYELESGAVFHLNYRNVVDSPPEHYLLGFDIKQAELRGIAGLAQEPVLLQSFADGIDPHRATAAMMLSKPPNAVTEAERDNIGKVVNFAIDYGLGDKALGEKLGIAIEEAAKLRDKFISGYPAIARWSAESVEFGKTHGYVLTHFGRRCPIWEYDSPDRYVRSKGDRLCVNARVQGSATGDYPKIAMVRLRAALKKAGMLDFVHLVMNVHDALYLYVHQSLAPQSVIEVLEPAVVFPVAGWPEMAVDWSVGRRWGSMKKLVKDDNGVWRAKEKAPMDTAPSAPLPVDDDEEESVDEAIEPDLNDQAVVATAPSPGEKPVLVVRITAMPDGERYRRFLDLARSRPGNAAVELCTPDGDVLLKELRTGLTPTDQPQISLALAGAEVRYRPTAEDTRRAMEGLTL